MIFIFLLLLFYVVENDVKKKKIFNESVMMCFVIGAFFLIFDNQQKISQGWIDSLVATILYFLFFIAFYIIGFMGAGDVKFGTALAFCFGVKLFFYVWCISILISIIYSIFDRGIRKNERIILVRSDYVNGGGVGKNVPYGAFLSISAMVVILSTR